MELIDRKALMEEIYHGKDKPTIYDKADFADWILECIQKAPEITDISETSESISLEQIQAGMTVYVVTKHIIHDWTAGTSHSFKDVAKCTVEKVVKKSDIIKYRVNGHFMDGEFYSSTITEKGVGKILFIDENDAKKNSERREIKWHTEIMVHLSTATANAERKRKMPSHLPKM